MNGASPDRGLGQCVHRGLRVSAQRQHLRLQRVDAEAFGATGNFLIEHLLDLPQMTSRFLALSRL